MLGSKKLNALTIKRSEQGGTLLLAVTQHRAKRELDFAADFEASFPSPWLTSYC